ncbi:MAG: M14 family metallopeptidase [Planctomycetes bacterium]|nr:M14 family metallopeptidase [Planctomycetota bacterium]
MLLPLLGLGLAIAPQQQPAPRTVPEASDYTQTSRAADVERLCRAAAERPHGDRLTLRTIGTSHGGHEQLLVQVALPDAAQTPRLRALVIGNIHGGEVEGKEALQLLVREFAEGDHADLLRQVDLWLLPIYNVDGNEAVALGNREGQNGPDACGERANSQGLDLNRDFVKVDAPETRTLLALYARVDPHLFVDLHTTNGSYHGYHLTYAPSLSPNVDPGVARATRDLLDRAQAAMRARGFQTFDYGNFETRDWDGSGAPESATGVRGWYTFDHRARYGIHYFGLRNRLSVLGEAYSYCDFATRIQATRAFVLCLLQDLVAHRADHERACADADRRLVSGDEPVAFGFATRFAEPEPLDVLVGEVDKIEGKDGAPLRYVRKGDGRPERMPVVRAFRATQQIALPGAWAILAPTADVLDRLTAHGVPHEVLTAARRVQAERFAVQKQRKPKRPFQGHQELVLEGTWEPAAPFELPAGTALVSARQPLARLAATLLEPQSEDSLSTWNFFEAQTDAHYPVLRVLAAK